MSGDMEMSMGSDLRLLLPEIIMVLTGVLALVAGMLRRHAWALPIVVAGSLLATGFTIPLMGTQMAPFSGTYRVDDLALWAKLILLPSNALLAILAASEVRGTDREATVYSLLALVTVGAIALASAGDLMILVLGVLLSSLGSFALVAYPRTDRATEGAMKYFVFGAVTGAVMIFGLTYWYGGMGSTLFADLGRLNAQPLVAALGLVAVLVGLGYKAAIAPFHFWAPDAYDGAPVSIAAYLSVLSKIGAIFGLAVILRNLPSEAIDWRPIIAVLAVVSMTYGNLAALPQTNVVRLLAYSSIAQAGYFLLGIAAIGRSGLAVSSLVVFAGAYAAMNIGAFAITLGVGRELDAFIGLGRLRPWLGAAMVVFLLSLVGVPPLAGFAGKLLLFSAAIDADMTWLAVIAILNSVLSLAVYLRVIVPMYRTRTSESMPALVLPVVVVSTVALVLTVLLGVGVELVTSTLSP